MKSRIVPIKNVARLAESAHLLLHRGFGLPGIGLVSGPTGFGKTKATTWLINRVRGVYVRATPNWSPNDLLGALCRELGITPRIGCSNRMHDIVDKLARETQELDDGTQLMRAIFIDEADNLVDRHLNPKALALTETMRSLYDMSDAPLILIGEEDLLKKLEYRVQFTGRILDHVRFAPVDAEDARKLADQLCDVKVRDDLLDRLHRRAKGSVRHTCIGLAKIEQAAKVKNLNEIGSAEWGPSDDFFTGNAPMTPNTPTGTKVSAIR